MSKRETLQQLQARIAVRLQQVATQTEADAAWLGVELGQQKILLPLQQSGEIHPIEETIEPLPYTKSWLVGIVALRGHIYSVVDLSQFLTHTSAKITSSEKSKQKLVAVNEALGLNVVFKIDELSGLRARDFFVRSEPAHANAPHYYGSIFYDNSNNPWQEINLQALVQDPQFLEISTEQPQRSSAPLPSA